MLRGISLQSMDCQFTVFLVGPHVRSSINDTEKEKKKQPIANTFFLEHMYMVEPRIYSYYKYVLCQDMIYTRDFRNIMQLPQIMQCVLNSSSALALKQATLTAPAQIALQALTTQKAKSTRARKSIAAFHHRKGNLLGCAVHLRGALLYSFLDQYIMLVSPRMPFMGTQRMGRAEKTTPVHYNCANYAGRDLNIFPGLETHFLELSNAGGFNLNFCTGGSLQRGELEWLLAAFQFPVAVIRPLLFLDR